MLINTNTLIPTVKDKIKSAPLVINDVAYYLSSDVLQAFGLKEVTIVEALATNKTENVEKERLYYTWDNNSYSLVDANKNKIASFSGKLKQIRRYVSIYKSSKGTDMQKVEFIFTNSTQEIILSLLSFNRLVVTLIDSANVLIESESLCSITANPTSTILTVNGKNYECSTTLNGGIVGDKAIEYRNYLAVKEGYNTDYQPKDVEYWL